MRQSLIALCVIMFWGCSSDTTTHTTTPTIPDDDDDTVADTTLPYIVSTSPTRGAIWVPVDCVIEATFSEAMDPTTVTEATFYFADSTPATVSYSDKTATLTPTDTLNRECDYLVYILLLASDTAGNRMEDHYRLNFTTLPLDTTNPPPDSIRPYITATNPADGDTGVALEASIVITFSERIDATTITSSTIQFEPEVIGELSTSYNIVTFIPTYGLMSDTAYTVTVRGEVADMDGYTMGDDYVWSFSTEYVEIQPIMPLAVGNQWTYHVERWDSISKVADYYDTVLVHHEVLIEDELWYSTGGIYYLNRGDGLWRIRSGYEHLLLKYPAIPGATNSFYLYPIRYEMTLVTTDTLIEVPAGTFLCHYYLCKVYDEVTCYCHYFYSPGTGMVKRIFDPKELVYIGGTHVLQQLMSFELQE